QVVAQGVKDNFGFQPHKLCRIMANPTPYLIYPHSAPLYCELSHGPVQDLAKKTWLCYDEIT
ncbi:MAG: hypothetical protein V1684_00175, partial [bacterium]